MHSARNIGILGSTGSIGTQTLDVIRSRIPGARVRALSCFSNLKLLAEQANEFRPDILWVPRNDDIKTIKQSINYNVEIVSGEEGLLSCAAYDKTDLIVNALTGSAGLAPTLAAINAGKDVALANKETLVTAGPLVLNAAREKNIKLTLIDSEHSAISQCLRGNDPRSMEKIILTASGGPFRDFLYDQIKISKAADALRHPTWKMGKKISIDSATMMNKGFEYIEAAYLYGLDASKIEVLIHPQSVVHSMVGYRDGSVIAQFGANDMRLAIHYALAGETRPENDFPRFDFISNNKLTFEAPDEKRFPCLALAKRAYALGGGFPAVLNAVNELAVESYLKDRIGFYGISDLIDEAFTLYRYKKIGSLAEIREAEAWASDYFERNERKFLI